MDTPEFTGISAKPPEGDRAEDDFAWMMHAHLPGTILARFRLGALTGAEHEALESHLLLCPVCQQQMFDECHECSARSGEGTDEAPERRKPGLILQFSNSRKASHVKTT